MIETPTRMTSEPVGPLAAKSDVPVQGSLRSILVSVCLTLIAAFTAVFIGVAGSAGVLMMRAYALRPDPIAVNSVTAMGVVMLSAAALWLVIVVPLAVFALILRRRVGADPEEVAPIPAGPGPIYPRTESTSVSGEPERDPAEAGSRREPEELGRGFGAEVVEISAAFGAETAHETRRPAREGLPGRPDDGRPPRK
jgi:hypothetical protein